MPPIPAHVADRLKVDRTKVRASAVNDPIIAGATDAELDAALATIDQAAAYDAHRATLTVQVWDRVSPINGVPAQHFLDRDDVDETGDHDIYLLLDNGQVVGFQPHTPGDSGIVRMPKGQGLARGNTHADDISAAHTADLVRTQVRAKIIANRATP